MKERVPEASVGFKLIVWLHGYREQCHALKYPRQQVARRVTMHHTASATIKSKGCATRD